MENFNGSDAIREAQISFQQYKIISTIFLKIFFLNPNTKQKETKKKKRNSREALAQRPFFFFFLVFPSKVSLLSHIVRSERAVAKQKIPEAFTESLLLSSSSSSLCSGNPNTVSHTFSFIKVRFI